MNGWSVERTVVHDSNSKIGNGWEIFRCVAVANACSNSIGNGNINNSFNGASSSNVTSSAATNSSNEQQ